jgi:hypothetical protein
MKLILTVDTFKSGEKNGIAWASASGIDAAGRRARAAFRDPREGDGRKRATAMIDQMARAIPEGQDVTDIRPIVECLGSWRDRPLYREGKPITRAGEPVKERYFEVASFNILSGPALELRRTKQRASEVVDAVAAALEAGDNVKAAETALEFLRLFSGRPADEIEDVDADEPDEPVADAPVAAAVAGEPVAAPAAPEVDGTVAPIEAVTLEAEPASLAPVAPTPTQIEAVALPTEAADVDQSPVIGTAQADVADQSSDSKPAGSEEGTKQELPNDDFESLVAAVEAAPPVHPEAAQEVPAKPASAAPARPDLGSRPTTGARPALPPRPAMGGLVRPGGPVAARGTGPVVQSAPTAQPARTVQAANPPAGGPAPNRGAAPQSTPARVGAAPSVSRPATPPRLAPSSAVAPPGGTGYRTPAPGEDPEALAAALSARTSRPGMPQSLRPAPARPGSR